MIMFVVVVHHHDYDDEHNDDDDDKGDDDEDVEVRSALRSILMAKITGNLPAAEQMYRSLPAGTRSQVQHTLQLTQLGVTERALMMLPMTVPMD